MFILEIGKHEMNTITVKMIYLQLMKMSSYESGGRKFWLKFLLVKMKIIFMRLWKKNEGKTR